MSPLTAWLLGVATTPTIVTLIRHTPGLRRTRLAWHIRTRRTLRRLTVPGRTR